MTLIQRHCDSSSPFLRKPLHIARHQEHVLSQPTTLNDAANTNNTHDSLPKRHLSLVDLLFIGVGGTVGSGIFVLTGQIASQYAGPCTFLSFALAGCSATLSGLCFAELSSRIPVAGSTYVYAYVCLGELAAVLAAACLTLEYGVSGAAVARSWGDKVQEFTRGNHQQDIMDHAVQVVNLPACLVSTVATLLLLAGVHESKVVTNCITAFKMVIVAFMTLGGLFLFQRQNMKPPLAPFGVSGVLRGATTSFFGYLGYDEVCCVAGEALHPERDMPRAVLGTLLIVTVCYVLAAVALTGMLPYDQISATSAFPDAFYARNIFWAGTFTAVGEVITLPVVVIISLMAQPRLTLSMAQDGLLPLVFAKLDAKGNIFTGTLIAGVLMTLLATFVPFTYLNDLVSAGILVAFCMTCSCLILLRCESPAPQTHLVEYSLALYNLLCFTTSILWSHELTLLPIQWLWTSLSTLATLASVLYMATNCPRSSHFGGSILPGGETGDTAIHYFQTPFVPYLPCLGIAVNWYLVAQLDAWGIFFLVLYLGAAAALYLWRCAAHSVGHRSNWTGHPHSYHGLSSCDTSADHHVEHVVELQQYPSSQGDNEDAAVI